MRYIVYRRSNGSYSTGPPVPEAVRDGGPDLYAWDTDTNQYRQRWTADIPSLPAFVVRHGKIVLLPPEPDTAGLFTVEIYDDYRE